MGMGVPMGTAKALCWGCPQRSPGLGEGCFHGEQQGFVMVVAWCLQGPADGAVSMGTVSLLGAEPLGSSH